MKKKDIISSLLLALLMIVIINIPSIIIKPVRIKEALLEGSISCLNMLSFGFIISFHCIGMCGGIIMLFARKAENIFLNNILYQLGRIFTVTAIGFVLGSTGTIVLSNKYLTKVIPLISGLVMLLEGCHILGLFKNIQVAETIPLLNIIKKGAGNDALLLGVMTALLPCGVYQTAQMIALGSGSGITGAMLMLAFALGTFPLPFLYGHYGLAIPFKYRKPVETASGFVILYFAIRTVMKVF